MPLTGLDIYKHLPKENCKECGQATCLAFAMKVAGGQAALSGKTLKEMGFQNVSNVGGFSSWKEAGGPTEE